MDSIGNIPENCVTVNQQLMSTEAAKEISQVCSFGYLHQLNMNSQAAKNGRNVNFKSFLANLKERLKLKSASQVSKLQRKAKRVKELVDNIGHRPGASDMYQEQFAELDNKPYHLFFTARLVDVPMLTDIVGVVHVARQRLELVECKVLQSDVHVPTGFVNRAAPTILPYAFAPGPKAGYYLVKMSEEARFVPQRREEEQVPPMKDEVDFGPDDFDEVSEPALSTFDVDMERSSSSKQTSRTMFGTLDKLQKIQKKAIGQQSQKSTTLSS
ncbi:hypothetical protein MBANPS3_011856 [Mucor bainieri]